MRKAVLIVEDDESAREALAAFLAAEGYPVREAANGREALDRPEVARERLRRDYPRSIEAARVALPAATPSPAPAQGGTVTVQIGAFADPARARTLVESAQRGGFPNAQVIVRGEGEARMHAVTLGVFGTREEARRAGERAATALGVTYQVERFP
jgi:CheY-like chemotaxis protein